LDRIQIKNQDKTKKDKESLMLVSD
jgi:hypothetical protein